MKIFISWSKPRSRALAKALAEWLPRVVQSVECFQSDDGIRAGQRWLSEINSELEASEFGILCVTPENVGEQWLNFEAGAIAKQVSARVVPVTLGFAPGLLEPPLGQFNGVEANAEGIKRLLLSIKDASNANIDVEEAFEVWWPRLATKLDELSSTDTAAEPPKPPSTEDRLAEVLGVVQGIQQDLARTRVDIRDYGRFADPAEVYAYLRFADMAKSDVRLQEALADADIPTLRRYVKEAKGRSADDLRVEMRLHKRLWTNRFAREAEEDAARVAQANGEFDDHDVQG